MKLLNVYCLALLPYALAASGMHADVFELNGKGCLHMNDQKEVPAIDQKEALVYLGEKFNIPEAIELGDAAEFLNKYTPAEKVSDRDSVLIFVKGAANPDELFENIKPSFIVEGHQAAHELDVSFSHIDSKLSDAQSSARRLTQEIGLMNLKGSSPFLSHFADFEQKLLGVWERARRSGTYKSRNIIEGDSPHISDLSVISDKLYRNELSHLLHLQSLKTTGEHTLILTLNSLRSLRNKVGSSSATYQYAEKVLSRSIVELSRTYDVTVLALPDNGASVEQKLHRRENELNKAFQKTALRGVAASSNSCFDSEEACQVSTSNCNSHGVCSKVKDKCWSCMCSATHNKTTSKTTTWSGFDCGKKDISSEANLFLWTSLVLAVITISGVKLLKSIGDEPLTGVLDSNSGQKKA